MYFRALVEGEWSYIRWVTKQKDIKVGWGFMAKKRMVGGRISEGIGMSVTRMY